MHKTNGWSVTVVGGAGEMGRYAVRAVARLGSADRLIIADRNVEYAERLAAEVGKPCEVLKIDATDDAALHKAFADCDVVCNTMGPFAVFGGPILRAALESGCHYLDIDDDWQSTVEALETNDLALANDVTAIIGLGGGPGVSNLLAVLAAEGLEEVHNLYTGWTLADAVTVAEDDYPSLAGASAAVEHWLIQCSDKIRIWDDGAYADVTPLEEITLDLPGFGERLLYTMGHPEPITLPNVMPGLRRSINLQSGPRSLLDHLRTVASDYRAGRTSLQDGARQLVDLPRPRPTSARDRRQKRLPYTFALAEGHKNSAPHSVMTYTVAAPPGRMGGHTGIPLAIGLELLRRGRVAAQGVLSPEAAIDPREFFDLYVDFLERPVCPVVNGQQAVVRLESDNQSV